jgi:parallel beta-helix repeat protein
MSGSVVGRETKVPGSARILFALMAASALLSAAPARASHVQCGDVITQDTKLDGNLLDCPDSGVVIGADGITLDLNGHVVDGVQFGDSDGVDNSAGHDGVTIENGSIREFRYGIAFQQADDGRMTGLHTRDVFFGVRLQRSDRNRVVRSNLLSYSAGVALIDDSQSNVVQRNALRHSANGVLLIMSGELPNFPPNHNLVVTNVISDNAYGIFGDAHFNRIERNSFRANTEAGIELFTSGGNILIANAFVDNAGGIELEGQTSDTTVSRNRVVGSAEDGISLSGAGTTGTTVIESNVSNGNGDDGIDVDTTKAVISQNIANDNGDLGIEAVPGVTDGGGNRARGNGNPAQCLNVSCK